MPEYIAPPERVRRIAFLGDVHMDPIFTARAIRRARDLDADVVVQAGDFGYTFERAFLEAVSAELKRCHLQLIFVDGNHEDHHLLNTRPDGNNQLRLIAPKIMHAGRGYRWQWDGISFLALGGAHSVDAGLRRRNGWMWHPEETITDGQVLDAVAGGPVDVMVSHDCPAGVDIPDLPSHLFEPHEIRLAEAHRMVLRAVVDQVQPRVIYHGHYHKRYTQLAHLGYGPVWVYGLADNGTGLDQALEVVDLETLRQPVNA